MPFSFSPTYEQLFDALLSEVADWRPRRGTGGPLTPCWTECGDRYVPGNGLLVLGRATNGFAIDLTPEQLASPDVRREKLRAFRAGAEGNPRGPRPLDWVELPGDADRTRVRSRSLGGTIGSRSAFWRVTHSLLREMTPGLPDAGWAQHLAWGNLCKIAPNVRGVSEGANPPWSLVDRQRDCCAALIRQEIAEARPSVVLVIAGEGWYQPFAPRIGVTPVPRAAAKYVRHVAAEEQGPFWIFTERPERRPQAEFVAELLTAHRELRAAH